jgi:predicted aconitase
VLVRLVDIPRGIQEQETFFPILGHLLGKISHDQIPVVEGMEISPTDDQFKALCAAAAASGMVGLFHMVGITPEAPTKEVAFQGRKPQTEIMITLEDIRATSRELSTAEGGWLNMVVVGCPHFSLDEFRHLIALLEDKTRHPDVQFQVERRRLWPHKRAFYKLWMRLAEE